MRLELPYPPSINGYWRCVGSRNIISAAGREYNNLAMWQIRQQLGAKHELLEGKLHVILEVITPDLRKRDLDNTLKVLLDCLTKAGVWADDSQVYKLTATRHPPSHDGGQVLVRIEPYGHNEPA